MMADVERKCSTARIRAARVLTAVVLAGAALVAAPGAGAGSVSLLGANGVELRAAGRWHLVPPQQAGATDPTTVLVAGTPGVVRLAEPRCQIAAYRVPPTGAAVVVVRWRTTTSGGGDPPRGRGPLRALDHVTRPSFECFAGRGAVAQLSLGGHAYQVDVLVGDRASVARIREALAAARSFDLIR